MTNATRNTGTNEETAVACLSVLPDAPDTYPLRRVLRGDLPRTELEYKDWIRAMQQTEGRMCIKWHLDRAPDAYYAGWFADGTTGEIKVRHPSGEVVNGEDAIAELNRAVDQIPDALIPVRREQTPFGKLSEQLETEIDVNGDGQVEVSGPDEQSSRRDEVLGDGGEPV